MWVLRGRDLVYKFPYFSLFVYFEKSASVTYLFELKPDHNTLDQWAVEGTVWLLPLRSCHRIYCDRPGSIPGSATDELVTSDRPLSAWACFLTSELGRLAHETSAGLKTLTFSEAVSVGNSSEPFF